MSIIDIELKHHKSELAEYSFYVAPDGSHRLHGEYIQYNKNGKIIERINYKHGLRHGEFLAWFNNGQESAHTFFYEGLVHGEYLNFCPLGNILHHWFYVHGEVHPPIEPDSMVRMLFQIKHPGFRFIEE